MPLSESRPWGPANDAVVVEHLVSPSKLEYSPKRPPAESGFPKYRLPITVLIGG
jgi:hypothetical protein